MFPESARKKLIDLLIGQGYECQGTIDWQNLVKLAKANGLGGMLYRNLRKNTKVPADVLETLKNMYLYTLGKVLFFEETYREIERVFQQAGIEMIPLKGIVFRYWLYEDPAERPAVDIDLLVKSRDFEIAHAAMLDAGYINTVMDDRRPISSKSPFERAYTRGNNDSFSTIVELHQGFSQNKRYPCNYGDLWKRSLPVDDFARRIGVSEEKSSPFGANSRFMSPEDTLMHQFVHNCMHMFHVPMHSLFDAWRIIEYWRPDWEQVIKQAHQWHVSGGAYLTLKLVRSLLNASVPPEVLNALDPGLPKRLWYSVFISEKPIQASDGPLGLLTLFRYTGQRRLQQALIGLPLIDGLLPSLRFALWYIRRRLRDHWAYFQDSQR